MEYTHFPFQWVLRLKRPGRDADHSPPSSAELRINWDLFSLHVYALMAWAEKYLPTFYLFTSWLINDILIYPFFVLFNYKFKYL